MSIMALGQLVSIQTGKLDANASSNDGIYPFFTCAKEPLKIAKWKYDLDAVLVAGNGDLNVKHYNGKFDAYQRTYILSVTNTAKLATRYLYYFLNSYLDNLRYQSIGGVIKYIKLGMLTDAIIPLPPLLEQRRIAAILDQASELRRKRQESRQKLSGLAQVIFAEMFSNEIGEDKRVPLGEIVTEFRYGTSNKSASVGHPTLRIPNVIGGRCNLEELKYVPVEKREFERLSLQDGDILFVRTNGNADYVGRSAVIDSTLGSTSGLTPKDFIFASYLIRARLKEAYFHPIFVQTYLTSDAGRKQIRGFAKTSAGQFNINTESLSALTIPYANFAVQRHFAERIASLAPINASYSDHLSKLDMLLSSLQHRAFSGELTAKQAEREREMAG